ncbi:MAG: redoxin domain-containing protein [Candidatus Riflebacteria bacterium]|nr:redoxin domain-containing protein [Candidatus Riflebacteria bacterium]
MFRKIIFLITFALVYTSGSLLALVEPVIIATASVATQPVVSVVPAWLTLFPEGLLDAELKPVDVAALDNKIVGIYFSAHWCNPCQAFTPKLVEFRNANRNAFEVVFVSSDENEDDKKAYMKNTKMEWLTIKWGSPIVEKLKRRYSIEGIPTLIIVGPDGRTISEEGRDEVENNASGAIAAWKVRTRLR